MADPETAVPRSPDGQGGVQVIARVGQVLRVLDGETQGLSLAQLADRVGLPRSTAHRIVTALVSEGLIATASPAGRVRIGPEFARLASSSQADLWKEAEPFMRRIFDEIGETVDCSVGHPGPGGPEHRAQARGDHRLRDGGHRMHPRAR